MRVKKRLKLKMECESNDPESRREQDEKSSSDFLNICLLLFLYVMQGIPLGLGAAIPYMLQSDANTASYETQATFSIAGWPFSLKLAWAPLVDSIYSSRIGRRKSWLIPVQYAIGIDLLILASHVDTWLGREPGNPWGPMGIANPVDITQLTAAFFGLTMLAATQDIVVDGWALTMLSKRNLGWASTCNTVGQMVGYVIAFILLLFLESPDIANDYLRQVPIEGRGLISFSGFLYFWGVVFLVSTTIVALLKQESGSTLKLPLTDCWKRFQLRFPKSTHKNRLCPKFQATRSSASNIAMNNLLGDEQHSEMSTLASEDDVLDEAQQLRAIRSPNHSITNDHIIEVLPDPRSPPSMNEEQPELSLVDTYRVMFGVLRLKPILMYIGLLFLIKTCFSAADAVTTLKLIECGVSKERMAFLGVMLLPFQAVLPLLITRWTNGPSPLSLFSLAIIPRLVVASLTIPLVYFTPHFRQATPVLNPLNATSLPNNSTIDGAITHSFTWSFYSILLVHLAIHAVLGNIMYVSQMAFHAKISDPAVGGTYMTLLNTAVNMAGSLPTTIFLSLVDPLSKRECRNADALRAGRVLVGASNRTVIQELERIREVGQLWIDKNATCKPSAGLKACQIAGGDCVTILDGFYLEVVFCILLGILTYPSIIRPLTKQLESLPPSAYSIRSSNVVRCRRKRRRRQDSS